MSVKVLYTTHAIATGGRNGHTRSADGIVDVDLSIPKAMGGPGRAGATTPEDLFAAGYAACFCSAVEFVARQAGVPIVAGTDGWGLELVREIEIYHQAGMSAAEALQTATINPARLVGVADRTGSIAVGKEADMVLLAGDVSRDLGALRRVVTVVSDGYVMDGDALRSAVAYSGMPK